MLGQRVVTAIVLLLVLAGAAWLGRGVFLALTAIVLGVACFEWLRLGGLGTALCAALGVAFGAVALALGWQRNVLGEATTLALLASAAAWIAIAAWLVRFEIAGTRLPRWLILTACPLLLVAAWLGFARLLDGGWLLLVSAAALVWVADIAAYFAGRAFGKRKLAPRISPGKTWAGVGGALLAVIGLALAAAQFWPSWPLFSTRIVDGWGLLLAAAALVALVALSVVGDLFESLMKRQAGVKDSSGLLPGHGGVLDRIDALLPVLPLAALMAGRLS